MNILGIETSCDETAAAIVKNGTEILSNVVVSQIDIFAEYGGVIPEIAARSHLEAIQPVIKKALKDANLTWDDIDAIAVTHTPGLIGSLLIGTLTARTLALIHNKPLFPVHHLKSHIYANWLKSADTNTINSSKNPTSTEANISTAPSTPTFPLLAPVISGGHTQLIYMTKHNHFDIIGTTRDDAIGECFDKIAKILGLPYPGGPKISTLAKSGDRTKYPFPHPKVDGLDFSFSGLKTAVLRTAQHLANVPISHPSHQLANLLSDQQKADIAASFEQTAIDILLEKIDLTLKLHPDIQSIVFAGGVSANQFLRTSALTNFNSNLPDTPPNTLTPNYSTLHSKSQAQSFPHTSTQRQAQASSKAQTTSKNIFFPAPSLSGDNGAMVASAAFFEIKSNVSPTDPLSVHSSPTSLIS